MPLPRPLLDHTVAALAAVLEFKHPADAVVSRYLRAHPILGQQDRAFVAETVFAVLRRLRLLETLAAGRDPRRLAARHAFAEIGRQLGSFDAVLLPIGAYAPRWFMRAAHMNPEEAVAAWADLGACGRLVAMHWGTFILSDEPVLEPPARLRAAWLEAAFPAADLSILRHGETLRIQRGAGHAAP